MPPEPHLDEKNLHVHPKEKHPVLFYFISYVICSTKKDPHIFHFLNPFFANPILGCFLIMF
jgi:hypothetical protein